MIFRLTTLVLICTYFFSCSQELNALSINEEEAVSDTVEFLALTIANDSIYMSSAVGYAGTEPEIWTVFQTLKEIATENELERLCEHESPVVRCYAFQALVENGYKDCYKMVENHLIDSTRLTAIMGCIVWEMTVSEFYLSVVTPNQITLKGSKLKDSELEQLREKKQTTHNKN